VCEFFESVVALLVELGEESDLLESLEPSVEDADLEVVKKHFECQEPSLVGIAPDHPCARCLNLLAHVIVIDILSFNLLQDIATLG
jgi:hypothetical protein